MQTSANGVERRLLWIGLLTVATIGMSSVFACAVPLAALAALGAFDREHNDGLLLVIAVWLANQIYGFTVLGYPHEAQAYSWGLTMGAGAIAAYFVTRGVVSVVAPQNALLAIVAALPVSFAVYEAAIWVGTLVISRGEGAFNADVVVYVAVVEAVAFLALLIAHRLAVAVGLVAPNAVESAA